MANKETTRTKPATSCTQHSLHQRFTNTATMVISPKAYSAANDNSLRDLDNLVDDLSTARIADQSSYGKHLDQQQRTYGSMSSLNGNSKNNFYNQNTHLYQQQLQQNQYHQNYKALNSPTPLQKIAKTSSAQQVDECAARLEMELENSLRFGNENHFNNSKNGIPRGVFVKDVVEEEIFIDHVPQYQPKAQRSDRYAKQKSQALKAKQRQVAFGSTDDCYDDEAYDNTDTEDIAGSDTSLNSHLHQHQVLADNSSITTTDPNKVIICHECNDRVRGQVITALGRSYHKEHFKCAHCNQELGTTNFYERDNLPYCERDYQALFSPKCAACSGPILDKVTIALDKSFHPEHFVCAHCGCQFEQDDGFHEKDGKPYCKRDFFDLFASKCGGCCLPITANYITALSKQWHPDCFVCSDCHCPFADGKFFDIEGVPYCEIHYHARRGALCAACKQPVVGKCTTAMFRKFHTDHFTCTYCLKVLTKTFKEENDKPYCHDCFDKLYS